LKIKIKEIEKKIIFWNLKNKKNGKIEWIFFKDKHKKRKKNLLAFRKQKNGKIGQKNPKNLIIIKEINKKGKQSNEKKKKLEFFFLN